MRSFHKSYFFKISNSSFTKANIIVHKQEHHQLPKALKNVHLGEGFFYKLIKKTRNLPHSGWYPLEWICYKDIAMKAQSLKYFSSLKYFTWAILAKM